jgi:hypothetical protein
MTNWMEITGISLQIFAGFVFILDQVAHKFSTSIEKWAGRVVTLATEKPKRRWRIVVLFSVVALPVIIITLLMWGAREEITWAAIGGVLIFTLIGFNVYGSLLILIGKRTLDGDIAKHMNVNALIEGGKFIKVNFFLLVISGILLSGSIYIIGYVQPNTDNVVLQILLVVLILISSLVLAPTFLFSLFFLSSEGISHLMYLMGKIKSAYYWIAIAVLWVAGGGLLLAYALSS